VAKYSCKGSHHAITRAGASPEQLRCSGVPEQLVQIAVAALRLSGRRGLERVGKWVHMLGFRGYVVTKSRGYSTTLGELRGTRAQWHADRDEQLVDEDESTPVLAAWEYIGSGYLNPGDVLLAAGVEASIRTAREALLDVRRRPPIPLTPRRCRSACRRELVA
jgi:replication initiator protein RepSA